MWLFLKALSSSKTNVLYHRLMLLHCTRINVAYYHACFITIHRAFSIINTLKFLEGVAFKFRALR